MVVLEIKPHISYHAFLVLVSLGYAALLAVYFRFR
jgi:hypothetical protein